MKVKPYSNNSVVFKSSMSEKFSSGNLNVQNTNFEYSDNFKKEKKQFKIQSILSIASIAGLWGCNTLYNKVMPKKISFNLEDIKLLAEKMCEKYKLDKQNFNYHFINDKYKIFNTSGDNITDFAKKELKNGSVLSYKSNKTLALALEEKGVEILHEIGHAVSLKKINKKYLGFIQKVPYLIPIIALLPVLSPPENQKNNKNGLERIGDFIKNNVILCSLATSLPSLIEEFTASKRALSTIKDNNPKIFGKSLKYLAPAFGTYLFKALALSFTAGLISKGLDIVLGGRSKQIKKQTETTNLNPPKKVAIIDMFEAKNIMLDWDFKPDLIHGKVVKRFIEEGLPNAQIDTFSLRPKATGNKDFEDKNLAEILDKIIKSKEKYDAINLSLTYDMSFENLSKLMGKEITPENFAKNKAEIKKWLLSIKTNEVGESLKNIVKSLDNLTASGTNVYIGAGNLGKNNFNLYSLADNVIVVGANNKNGKKARFSSNNSLVNRWEQGVFYPKRIKDVNGNRGFDYTEDGTIDIPLSETTSWIKLPLDLHGASFSAPKALIKDMNQ